MGFSLSREELKIALPALAIILLVQLRLLPYCADDAYIHFRIAENFLTTGAPYFNPGEAVMATSSTVWTLLLSCVFLFTGSSVALAAILNSFIIVAAAVVWSRLARLLYGQENKLLQIVAFLLTLAALLSSSIQLMETPLALLLLGIGLLNYFQSRATSFVWLTLACLTRLEMSVFLAVIFVENIMHMRVSLRQALLRILLTAAPIVVFDLYFFGTVIPQTVTAKSVIYDLSSSEFITFAAAGLLGKHVFYNYPLIVLVFLTLLTTTAIYFCLQHLHPPEYVVRDQRALVILAGGLLTFLLYAIRSVYIFPWYVPIYSLPIFFAVVMLAYTKKSTSLKLIAAILIVPTAFSFGRDLAAATDARFFSEYEGGVRARVYREAGQAVRQSCPNCTLMAAEIGGLGAGFRGKIIDAVGLATPQALEYHRKQKGSRRAHLGGMIPLQFVRDAKPDIIVGMQSFLQEITSSDVAALYRSQPFTPKSQSETEALGEAMLILKRQG